MGTVYGTNYFVCIWDLNSKILCMNSWRNSTHYVYSVLFFMILIHLWIFLDLAVVFMETIKSTGRTSGGANLVVVELEDEKIIEKVFIKIEGF